jgi:putative peptidoglycan lipid II flippase
MVAVTVPTAIGGVIGASLGTSLVPAYAKMSARNGPQSANRLCISIISFTTIVSLTLIPILYYLSEPVIHLLAPSLPEATASTAIGLLKLLSVLVLGYSLYNVQTSIYNARQHFTMPAIADVLSNFFVIGSLVFLTSLIGIYALATGLILGVYAVVATLLIVMVRNGLFGFDVSFGTKEFREYLLFSFPIFLYVLIPQLGGIIENYFASGLKEGSIAALGYAKRLSDVASTLMAVNIAKALFPTFSALSSEDRIGELRDLVLKLNRQIIIFFTPFSVTLMYFRKEIVGIVFMRGAFGVQAMEMTSDAFMFYVVGFIAYVMVAVFFRLCYAFSDSATPLKAAVVSILFLIVGNSLLVPVLGITGIALTTSLSVVVNLSILFFAVRKKLGGLGVKSLAKSFHLSLLCGTVPLLPIMLLERAYHLHFILGVVLYLFAYFTLCWVFMRDELQTFLATIGTMWVKKK